MSDPRLWDNDDMQEFYARFDTPEEAAEAAEALMTAIMEARLGNYYNLTHQGEEDSDDDWGD
jgi:hypothetical protein